MIDKTIARALVLSLGLFGCSHDKQAESPRTTSYEDGPEAGMTPASGSVTTDEAAAASGLGANSTESLNDAQIAAVAGAINASEIDQAKIAISKAQNASVKSFAETMLAHHSQAVRDIDELQTRVGLEATDSRLLAQLRVEAKATEDKLDESKDAPFDRLYMLSQIDAHQKALETLDGRLIPNARNVELRQLLENMRPRVASHLEMARSILNTLR